MARCPFCRKYLSDIEEEMCECGEILPKEVYRYRRERRMCGKTVRFEPIPSFPEEIPRWETD